MGHWHFLAIGHPPLDPELGISRFIGKQRHEAKKNGGLSRRLAVEREHDAPKRGTDAVICYVRLFSPHRSFFVSK